MFNSSSTSNQKLYSQVYDQLFSILIPPVSASIAIIPCFGDLLKKSALQKGEALPKIRVHEIIKGGLKAAPTVGAIVGSQMILQNLIQQRLGLFLDNKAFSTIALSSCLVGMASAPILAIFNGQTMGISFKESLKNLSLRQACAISVQETAFVGGLSVADKISSFLKKEFKDHILLDYAGAFIAGACGSLAGHPANTALTRWQSGLKLESAKQSLWGSMKKARAIGCFSVIYKISKDSLSSLKTHNELK